jgi:uncharacterized protein
VRLAGVVLAAALTIPPAPTARVNDYAGLLTAAEQRQIENVLAERERATGAQVVIAIFKSLEGESLEDFSIKLAEQWRIGQKGLDNGAIVVVFVAERKVRIEVGYGLEPVVPDALAGQIIREVIAPQFRQGRYAAGLEAAARAIYDRVDEVKSGKPAPRPAQGRGAGGLPVVGFFVLLGVIVLILGLEASRSQRFVGRRGYTASRGGWAGPIIFPGGWGGGWRGGGSGGGGDSGGFSGGGGGFGGGGASGEW